MSRKHRPESPPKSAPAHAQRHKRSGKRGRNLTAVWVGLGVVAVLAAALLLLRPKSSAPTEVTAAQAYEKYQAGVLVVDMRTQEEWNQGHIDKSILIPLDELPNRLNELPKDRDIVVVCHTGIRAKEGATILSNAGFTRVSCLSGGLQAWIDTGYPVQQ